MPVRSRRAPRAAASRKVLFTPLAVAAAAAAWPGLATPAAAAPVDVVSVETTYAQAAGPTSRNLQGAGNGDNFPSSRNYQVTWAGGAERIDALSTADGGAYEASSLADLVVRRGAGPDADVVWYRGSGNSRSDALLLESAPISGLAEAFAGNNLLVGADNVFANTGDPKGNNVNVERLDFIFTGGFRVGAGQALAIFDRGAAHDHDGFQVVAITSLSGDGTPDHFGTPLLLGDGAWGRTDVVPAFNSVIMRRDDSEPEAPFRPSDSRRQGLGGVLVPLTDLAAEGETVYGYALLAPDTAGSGAGLADWTDPAAYPADTANDFNDAAGGLDPIGVSAVLYTSVPEPSALGVIIVGAGLVGRRGRARAGRT